MAHGKIDYSYTDVLDMDYTVLQLHCCMHLIVLHPLCGLHVCKFHATETKIGFKSYPTITPMTNNNYMATC